MGSDAIPGRDGQTNEQTPNTKGTDAMFKHQLLTTIEARLQSRQISQAEYTTIRNEVKGQEQMQVQFDLIDEVASHLASEGDTPSSISERKPTP